MNKETATRSLLIWLLFIPIAILNGAIRNFIYKPFTGELLAHQISSLTASLAFAIFAYFMLQNKIKELGTSQLFTLGLFWVGLTILFEFGFGHYIMGNSWEKLLADYNVFNGRIWLLVLLTEFITPFAIKLLAKHK